MRITELKAVPISFLVPEGQNVTLGIGRAVKRDAVLVRIETDEGLVGWGEAHHGRCPGAIAKLIDTTMRELVIGADPLMVHANGHGLRRLQKALGAVGKLFEIHGSGVRCVETTNLYRLTPR